MLGAKIDITFTGLNLLNCKTFIIFHHPHCCYSMCHTRYNLFAHSSCTYLFILLFIKSRVYCIAHFILLHILILIFSSYFYYIFTYIYIYSLVLCFPFLHCPLSGPVLIYISLLIISCIIEYVMNKITLNLGPWTLSSSILWVRV